ncbi:hypothetical protein EDB86DRAFT_3160208 [Lactarius hatsudake]|nr:hypothetical protein EDB86DRAFT_3160208 [Lactarius hatsudake]
MLVADYLHTLTGPVPTPFSGNPAQAQQFIDEVELALTFIRGPTADLWKGAVRRGRPDETTDEGLWDEFFDSFCTAWIDETPMHIPQTPSPLVNASAVQHVEEPRVITTTIQTMTPAPSPTLDSPTQIDGPPPRPPHSPRRPSSPRIALATPCPTPVTHTLSAPADTVKLDFAPIDPAPMSSPLPATMSTPVDKPLASADPPLTAKREFAETPAALDPVLIPPPFLPLASPISTPPPRPPRSLRRPHSPRIVSPPLPVVKDDKGVKTSPSASVLALVKPTDESPRQTPVTDDRGKRTPPAPHITSPPLTPPPSTAHAAQRIAKRTRDNRTEEENEARPGKRLRAQLARRSTPLPHKIAYRRRCTLSTPPDLALHADFTPRPPRLVVEDDNNPERGVNTLANSDGKVQFSSVQRPFGRTVN